MKSIKFLTVLAFIFAAFVFQSCEEKKDPCDDVTCMNGGVCVEGDCDCPEGYSGTSCETKWRSKMLGSFSLAEVCNNNSTTNSTAINSVDPNNDLRVISNISTGDVLYMTMTGVNTFDISFGTLEGNGTIDEEGVIEYILASGTLSCTYTSTPL